MLYQKLFLFCCRMGALEEGPNYKKRPVTLSDQFGRTIDVKLWGEQTNLEIRSSEKLTVYWVEVDLYKFTASLNSTPSTSFEVIVSILTKFIYCKTINFDIIHLRSSYFRYWHVNHNNPSCSSYGKFILGRL